MLQELLFFENGDWRHPSTDRVRLSLSSPDLNHAIWIAFMPPEELTVDRVLEAVERVLQSSREWLLTAEFVHATLPRGGGKFYQRGVLMRLGHHLERRRCLLKVTEDKSNLCCSRALVLCKAYVDGMDFRLLRRSPSKQRIRTINLMKDAGIPRCTRCGPTEWRDFQNLLGLEYGIVVISRQFMNMAVYNGLPGAPKKLILWHLGEHYHGLKTLAPFYGKRSVCTACLKCVHDRSNHRCEYTCFYCTKAGGSCTWIDAGEHCEYCDITYPNASCLKDHTRICAKRR